VNLYDHPDGAILSADGEYRYRLWRTLTHPDQRTLDGDAAADDRTLAFVLLNPSTAEATTDDPTVRRCLGYADRWGFDRVEIGNLFAYRATDPDELYDVDDPVGPENDDHLRAIADVADLTVVGWGHYGGGFPDRVETVVAILGDCHALCETDAGQPRHPLYVPADVEPGRWSP
jgi:hypothetical protein